MPQFSTARGPFLLRGCANRRSGSPENLAQYERQDAAVLVVVHLDRRIDAQQHLDLRSGPVLVVDHDRHFLARVHAVFDTEDVDGLVAFDAERGHRVVPHELEGQHAHHDEVGAVDALEALDDHGTRAEEQRALGGPVARAARAVLLAANTTLGTPSAIYFIAAS